MLLMPPEEPGRVTVARRRQLHGLTARQREVAQLLRAGKKYYEIARELGVDEGTVRTHVEHLYRRLGIASRWELLDLPARTFGIR